MFDPYTAAKEPTMKTDDPRAILETQYSVTPERLAHFTEPEAQSILDLAARTASKEQQPSPERLAEIAEECAANMELAIQATTSEIIYRS